MTGDVESFLLFKEMDQRFGLEEGAIADQTAEDDLGLASAEGESFS